MNVEFIDRESYVHRVVPVASLAGGQKRAGQRVGPEGVARQGTVAHPCAIDALPAPRALRRDELTLRRIVPAVGTGRESGKDICIEHDHPRADELWAAMKPWVIGLAAVSALGVLVSL